MMDNKKEEVTQDISRKVAVSAPGRLGTYICEGYDKFEAINVLMYIVNRAQDNLKMKLGREVDLQCSFKVLGALAESKKPYRGVFVVEEPKEMWFHVKEWDDFPIRGEGAKEFAGSDFFVTYLTEDKEGHIEQAAYGEVAEKLRPVIKSVWEMTLKGQAGLPDSRIRPGYWSDEELWTLANGEDTLKGDTGITSTPDTDRYRDIRGSEKEDWYEARPIRQEGEDEDKGITEEEARNWLDHNVHMPF